MITEELTRIKQETEPRLPRINYADRCGVEGCPNNATPYIYCAECRAPLCGEHKHFDFVNGRGAVVLCPTHKGEEK